MNPFLVQLILNDALRCISYK